MKSGQMFRHVVSGSWSHLRSEGRCLTVGRRGTLKGSVQPTNEDPPFQSACWSRWCCCAVFVSPSGSARQGHESSVLVGSQTREFPGTRVLDHDRYRPAWGRFWMGRARWLRQYSGRVRGAQRISERWLPRLASPYRFWSWWAGHEDFDFPGTRHLLEQAPFMPDVVHLNNLHMECFDLRELPRLSRAGANPRHPPRHLAAGGALRLLGGV